MIAYTVILNHKPISFQLPNSKKCKDFDSKRYTDFPHRSGACLTWPLPAVEILHPGEILEVQLKSWKVVGDFFISCGHDLVTWFLIFQLQIGTNLKTRR